MATFLKANDARVCIWSYGKRLLRHLITHPHTASGPTAVTSLDAGTARSRIKGSCLPSRSVKCLPLRASIRVKVYRNHQRQATTRLTGHARQPSSSVSVSRSSATALQSRDSVNRVTKPIGTCFLFLTPTCHATAVLCLLFVNQNRPT